MCGYLKPTQFSETIARGASTIDLWNTLNLTTDNQLTMTHSPHMISRDLVNRQDTRGARILLEVALGLTPTPTLAQDERIQRIQKIHSRLLSPRELPVDAPLLLKNVKNRKMTT